jgi:small subunit ribosomal protein S6
MNFYELTFIVRQEISSADLDKTTESFLDIIKSFQGNVLTNEYWGLKNLAYKILNNKKGHYVFWAIEISKECKEELERKIKLSEHVIRHLILRVESVSKTPEQMFRNSNAEIGAINVTI